MRRRAYLWLAMIATAMFFATCTTDESDAVVEYELVTSPDTLVIADGDLVNEFYISAKPKGKIDYLITSFPQWLQIEATQGVIKGDILPVEVTSLAEGMDEGIYKGKIELISNIAGASSVQVVMSVGGHPKIKTNLTQLSFPTGVSSVMLEIENSGTGLLVWEVNHLPSWLSVSKNYDYLQRGEKSYVEVRCTRDNLDMGTLSDVFKIESNSEITLADIPVSMEVPETKSLQVGTSSLLFDYFTVTKSITLKNTGNTAITWNSIVGNGYLALNPAGGALAKGESVNVEVVLDRNGLASGIHNTTITFTAGSQNSYPLGVVVNHFEQSKWLLTQSIIDAEFCEATNKIVAVSSSPNQLLIIDAEAKTVDAINLNSTPKCVSVSPNGEMAVVGHNGFLTYVSLTSKAVAKEMSISCDVFDVAIKDNYWCYVSPNIDQWENLRSVNYATGGVTVNTASIYEKSVVKIQPGSQYLYLCNSTLSSTDLEKFDTSNGNASYLYYNFDAYTGGKFWFSDNGTRMFCSNKRVYKASDVKANDMQYNGSVETTGNIYWIDHCEAANKLFAITKGQWYSDPIGSQIEVLDGTYLNFLKSYPLEQFLAKSGTEGGRVVNSEGRFVFANLSGTKIYVLVQAAAGSGLPNDWAVQVMDIQ